MTPERWRQITGLFHEARLRTAADRPGFLNDACAGDDALRAEVEAMLSAHDDAVQAGGLAVPAIADPLPELESGSAIGPYRIDGLIGAGGMGQVYRASDSRIGRDVAVKVLPSGYAADTERMRRFEQEARASGALNHPNVLTLYDVGTSDGRPYLVTELLDGETLRDRIARGPVPAVRACGIAAAIARGLAAAHAKGIVHRDLKPENVMITRDGRVKILDFGIAKLRSPDPRFDSIIATAPQLTEANTVLGTPGYMAPEQIRGDDADERADLFALGAILFEMVTGRRAFDRPSRIETLHAVLHDDAPSLSSAAGASPVLDHIVQRCLEKDPDARFQSARDLAFALETIAATSTPTAAVTASTRRWFDWRLAAVAALVIASAAAIAFRWSSSPPAPASRELVRFSLQPPPRLRFVGPPAISADGTMVAFAASEGPVETRRLYVRRIDQTTSVVLPGSEGGLQPLFSPDGKSLAFWAGNMLKRSSVDGAGLPVDICAVEQFLGGTWTADGTIVFGSNNHALQRVPAAGGVPQPLTMLDGSKSEVDHHTPEMLPGDRALLLTVHEADERFRIDVLTLATGARHTALQAGLDATYSRTGHLVYGSDGALLAAPFDVDALQTTGATVKLIDDVATNVRDVKGLVDNLPNAGASFALSTAGTLVFQPRVQRSRRTLAWADRSGETTPLPLEPRMYWTPQLSPDARQFAVVIEEGGRRNISIYRFETRTLSPVTFEGDNWAPVWTPDGSRLTYFSRREGVRHLMWQRVDANSPAESLLSSRDDDLVPGAWSADGRSLIYVNVSAANNSDLRVLDMATRKIDEIPGMPARVASPVLSPDGRWLAFGAFPGGVTGRPSIYVQPFPGSGPVRQIVEGAGNALWSHDGKWLFFRSRRGANATVLADGIFEVPFDQARGIPAGPSRQLFRKVFADWGFLGVPGHDVAPDGRFLLVLSDESESVPRDFHVLLHVDDELRRRAR